MAIMFFPQPVLAGSYEIRAGLVTFLS
jgi:hypothetical protein